LYDVGMEIEWPDDVAVWLDDKARMLGHGDRVRAAVWALRNAMAADYAERTYRYRAQPQEEPTSVWAGLVSEQRRRVDGR
jgi:hypothetical protein